ALSGTAWREPCREGRPHQCSTAADGKDGCQSERSAEEGIRRLSNGARRQSLRLLSRCGCGSLLRLQPPWREGLEGRTRELVAARHDGRREGALRRNRR